MEHQIRMDPAAQAGDPVQDEQRNDGAHQIAPDLAYKRLVMVNVVFYGPPNAGDRKWVLVDAGVPGMASLIASAAEKRFGTAARPAAIILTHGHVDHVGSLEKLLELWDAPVYAHELELPYLDGRAAYPPPDTAVGNGIMSSLAGMFPRGPFDFRRWLHVLPEDGSVPEMPGWRWLHTPGHTPGHVSLWREADRTLIAGDAFVTTNQESAYSIVTQRPEMHGPPMYMTPDWQSARTSVEQLAALEPEVVVAGHGHAMHGAEMRAALHTLAQNFDRIAIPPHGRYVLHPARAEDGSAYVAGKA